jgi:hypothetical protein
MSSAHFWTFSGFFGFFGIYTQRKKSGRTMLTPGALKYKKNPWKNLEKNLKLKALKA